MKTTKILLAAGALAAVLSATTPARAEVVDYQGFYMGGFGTYNYLNGNESTPYSGTTAVGTTSEIEFDSGFGAGLALGYSLGNGLRTELEYAYRKNDVEDVDPNAVGADSGDVKLQTIMANVAYDLPVELLGFARPYAGVGLGYGMAEYNQVRDLGGFTIDDDGNGLAYQAFGGLGFNITPRFQATLEYRYVGTDESELATTTSNVNSDLGYGAHNIMLGARYQFGEPMARAAEPAPAPAPMPVVEAPRVMPAPAPRPAPVAQPAPVVAQTYIVFFDFDKSVITPEAQRVLQRAANDVRVGQGAKIHVIGHADRAGSPRYNQRLSERRATVVRNELITLGVNGDMIEQRGLGETTPRVPTADGVREAQNRRAEIIFQ